MLKFYKLIDRKVVEAESIEDMIANYDLWTVKKTDILGDGDQEDVFVSTVFLGQDLSFGMSDDPIVFETMIFGGPYNYTVRRFSSIEDAETCHDKFVEKIRKEYGRK